MKSTKSLPKKPSKFNSEGKWEEIGGERIYFRSKAERLYAKYCQWLMEHGFIKSWEYEPQVFEFPIKHGTTRYTPDFRIVENNGTHWWAEVKGYMDAKSKTKITRFRKYYPEEKLSVIDSEWVKKNKNKINMLGIT